MFTKHIHNMKLSHRMMAVFLFIGITPLAVSGYFSLSRFNGAISEQAKAQLTTVRDQKIARLNAYFTEAENSMKILGDAILVIQNDASEDISALLEYKAKMSETWFDARKADLINYSHAPHFMHALSEPPNSESTSATEAREQIRQEFITAKRYQDCYYNFKLLDLEGNSRVCLQGTNESEAGKSWFQKFIKATQTDSNQNSFCSSIEPDPSTGAPICHVAGVIRNPETKNALGIVVAYCNAENITDLNENNGGAVKMSQGDSQGIQAAGTNLIDADGVISEKAALFFKSFQKHYEVYDVLLINPDGLVVYTGEHRADSQTNLIDGPYAATGLGRAFRKAVETHELYTTDFESYPPNDNRPASFMAQPVMEGGKVRFVAAIQLNLEKINALVSERSGLGSTGETYLVGRDYLMRSDSYNDPQNRTVFASFSNPQKGRIETDIVKQAIAGNSGIKASKNYKNKNVLSSYAPFGLGEFQWAMISEIEANEALASVKGMQMTMTIIAVLGILGTIFLSLSFTKQITGQLKKGVDFARKIAQGDLTLHLEVDREDELGELIGALNTMSVEINKTITKLDTNASESGEFAQDLMMTSNDLASGAEQMASQSSNIVSATEGLSSRIGTVAAASEQMSSSVNTVATAIEEMSASLNEVAKICTRATQIASNADSQANQAAETMNRLNTSATEINTVLDTISDIADQTNLLALNATIEAASAGEAGKGFAVVANEVKELAKQTAQATEEIARQIKGMQGNTSGAVKAINEITKVIAETNLIVQNIAGAVEEQSSTTNEIAQSVSGASQAAQEIAKNMEEAASGAHDINSNIHGMDDVSKAAAAGAAKVDTNSTRMAELSMELLDLVRKFKLTND
ncbi:MAG: methyl-accepting chemotaxis protein [Candidatus Eisenbacteria bacterium]|uniref:Methyl-accepting chemotaxis protein n=1 Tax=Eiseniibacteriota bacterium TaxID=2212470 RepID=A0A948W715_UNCEI|nr:methyl-accepting chemotaxis protein [Candidatus Eisenbacteria bacterium]MBU1949146.1 methyl-accepting chemotaxis protein [Candidatus Eisenbacteria bacterium]MBU2692109.1 methyl-accepting chemotaxis protein [Candidatus Eisenbacteria bacterium]